MKSSSTNNNDEAPPPPKKEGHVFNLRKRKVPRIATAHMGKSKPLEIILKEEEELDYSDCVTPPSQTIEGRLELYFVYFVWTVLSFVLIMWVGFILLTGVGCIIGHDVMKKHLVEFLNDPMAPFRGKYEFSLGF